jgi:hypothetical protein
MSDDLDVEAGEADAEVREMLSQLPKTDYHRQRRIEMAKRAAARGGAPIRVVNYRRMCRDNVRGWIDVVIHPLDLAIRNVKLVMRNGQRALEYPFIPMVGKNGRYKRNDEAQIVLGSALAFADGPSQLRFECLVLDEVVRRFPYAFMGQEEVPAETAHAAVAG